MVFTQGNLTENNSIDHQGHLFENEPIETKPYLLEEDASGLEDLTSLSFGFKIANMPAVILLRMEKQQ